MTALEFAAATFGETDAEAIERETVAFLIPAEAIEREAARQEAERSRESTLRALGIDARGVEYAR